MVMVMIKGMIMKESNDSDCETDYYACDKEINSNKMMIM